MWKLPKKRLYCFSPEVMLTTFIIESGAALYILFKYRFDRSSQLITALLGFLALFQLSEYMVCEGAFYLSSLDWARLGYASITILPPLAIHLGLHIAKKKNVPLIAAAYGSAAVFSIFFLFVGHGMQAQQCLGNYVIFTIAPYASLPYGIYYNGWLIAGIIVAWHAREQVKELNRQKALIWLIVGYLSFMLPTITVNLIDHNSFRGVPSIMCGFAILMAVILLFKVSPLILKDSHSAKETAKVTTK